MLKKMLLKIREKQHHDINHNLQLLMRISCKPEDELSVLCDIYGSDKGSMYLEKHTYTKEYFELFKEIKNEVTSIFECGIGTNDPKIKSNMGVNGKPGASLRVWRDYFKNAKIFAADIDKNILFRENRIYTGYIDQTNPEEINKFFESIIPYQVQDFNIIIDDGLHTYEAAICLYENAFQYVKKNGFYIIEDMHLEDIPKFKDYFNFRENSKGIDVEYKIMSNFRLDNNLIIIKKL